MARAISPCFSAAIFWVPGSTASRSRRSIRNPAGRSDRLSSRSSFSGRVLFGLLTAALLRGQSTVAEDYARASQLVGQRHADEAIPILESIIGRAPAFYRAYAELADAYLQKRAPER